MFSLTKRRAIAIVAVAATAVTLAACSSSGSSGTANDGVLNIFAPQGPDQNFKANSFTAEMEKLTGEKINWQTTTYDGGAAAEVRQVTLASGTYPEVFMLIPWVDHFSQEELIKFGEQGVLIPLNDLIKKYAPNIQKTLDDDPNYKAIVTAPDGNIYGLSQLSECFHCTVAAKLWMNSEWLEKLGLEQPTTTDELFDVLMAFKTQDPNGNGIADEIPLTSSAADQLLPYFMNAFLFDPQGADTNKSTLALDGDDVVLQATNDAWREGLAYMAKLYANGLIDPAAFTQNRDALKAEGDNADAVIVGAAAMHHPVILTSLGQADGRDKAYDPVAPLKGPEGVQYAQYQSSANLGATFAITNTAGTDEQIAALKIMDSLFTIDGGVRAQFGVEGAGWVKPEAGDIALDQSIEPLYKAVPTVAGDTPRNDAWGPISTYYSTTLYRNSQVQPLDIYSPDGYERRLFDATKLYQPYQPMDQVFPLDKVWIDPSDSAEVAKLETNINSYVDQASAEFVTGSRDIANDQTWDDYLSGLKALGLPRYLEIQQKAYNATK